MEKSNENHVESDILSLPREVVPFRQRSSAFLWLRNAMTFVSIVLIFTAFLPLVPVDWWWIRIGDFPRIQLLVCYVVALLVLVAYRKRTLEKVLIFLLVVGVGIQIYWIYPYLPIARQEVESARSYDPQVRLRVLSANLLQSNHKVAPLLELIDREQPDVVVLCELNARWALDLAPLHTRFSFQLVHPLENTYGIALFSNLEVVQARVRTLVRKDIPSIDARIRIRSGHEFRLFALHPNPPRPGESTRKRDAELVLVGREVVEDQSAVVLGDLNDVGWSRTTNLFQEVSQLLDPRKGRGMFPTFSADSWIWRYPLDYLFHSTDFRVVELKTLTDIGSDHFPLLVELSHEPTATATQEAPHLDADDREDAQEAVEAVGKPS